MELKFNNLGYTYRKGHVTALEGVTATVGHGVYLLLGENGAGKTTLMQIADGLRFATAGSCTIDGVDVSLRLPSVTSRVFYLGNDIYFPARDLAEMVEMHAGFYPNFDAAELEANLAAFGLNMHMRIAAMSTGIQRKAMVAYGLALNADLLLLDEPTNGLDIESKINLQKLIARNCREGQTIIISTHHIADLENLYDGVLMLKGARLVLAATLDDITDTLAFTAGPLKPAEALHAELYGGQWHAIMDRRAVDADTAAASVLDFRLLYTGVRGPQGPQIVEIINAEKTAQDDDNK